MNATNEKPVPTLKQYLQPLYPYYVKARKAIAQRDEEYRAECEEYYSQGYRPHYCKHGRNLWVEYDVICGPCEDSLEPLMEAVNLARKWQRAEAVRLMRQDLGDYILTI